MPDPPASTIPFIACVLFSVMYSAKIRKFRWSAKFFLLICAPDCHCAGMWAACGLWIGVVHSFFCPFSAVGSARSACFLIQLRKGAAPRPSVLPAALPVSAPSPAFRGAVRCDGLCSALRCRMQCAAMADAARCVFRPITGTDGGGCTPVVQKAR